MNNIVRIGVVGAGSISLRGILPHLTQEDVSDRLKVTAVCDPFPERANAAAERFGIPSAYEHYEDMLASGNVDAVTIASPIGIHYEQGKLAIENGIHVHFNKTMTTTVDEADELIKLAREHNVKLVASPGQMLRPINQRIKELIQDGAIGTLTWAVTGSAFGTYHEQEPIRQGDDVLSNINPSWYFRKPGGGPLYDMTVYGLHTMTGILGPAKQVTAFSGIRIHEREFRGVYYPTDIDDNTLMILDFGSSLFGFVYGVAAGSLPNTWTPMFFGTKGVISGNTLNGQQIQVKGDDNSLPHVVGIHKNIQESHVFEDIMQLVDWIREDKPSIVTAEHARHIIEIFESAYRSAESKQAQILRTTF
ncbi:MAG: Gfo/Idh/MocA family protein [bacterium]